MKIRSTFRGLDELGLELVTVTIMAIVGLLLLSHALHTSTAERLKSVPLVGTGVAGVQAAVDEIVTAPA